ncbi:MAG: Flp family type IVb pilin [Chloroflexi bacterium]|nr:Flp family type IVb pilin [Chloroflexota bacterium]
MKLIDRLSSGLRGQDGQGVAEYALILALIAVLAIGALMFLGGDISRILDQFRPAR